MMGSRKEQVKTVTDQVARAVKSAGAVVAAALYLACGALAVALAALILAVRMRPADAR
jgi:hypothetical protein